MHPFSNIETLCELGPQKDSNRAALAYYERTSIDSLVATYERFDAPTVHTEIEKKYLRLFHHAATRVPAYKDFLRTRGVNPDRIQTLQDYAKLPPVDKDTYLKAYPLWSVCMDGVSEQSHIISVSSGSSGKPFFWPRGIAQELETTLTFEAWLKAFYDIGQKKTLFLDCFALGMYVGGIHTLTALMRIAQKGYPIVLTTPGNTIKDIIRIIEELEDDFDQILLAGYAPLMKDVVDVLVLHGRPNHAPPIRFLFSGEEISESWRNNLLQHIKASNPYATALNGYGTADMNLIAHETPTSIYCKQKIEQDPLLRSSLIHSPREYTFAQYNPYLRFIEEESGELLISAATTIPLIRYAIHDRGGIHSYEKICLAVGAVTEESILQATNQTVWKLPFLHVFGKSDQTIILYGANIYPEHIKQALETTELSTHCSGKFSMERLFIQDEPVFSLYLELKTGIVPNKILQEQCTNTITHILLECNNEYCDVYTKYGTKKAVPQITLLPFGEGTHFGKDIKQRWVPKK